MTYRGWDTSKDFLEKVVQEQGPFDGIMGFSQVHLHLDRVRKELCLSCSATDGMTSHRKWTLVMTSWQTTTYASQCMLQLLLLVVPSLLQLMKLTHRVGSGRRLCIHSSCSTDTGCHASGRHHKLSKHLLLMCFPSQAIWYLTYQCFEQPAYTLFP